jgi:hypothetical protein
MMGKNSDVVLKEEIEMMWLISDLVSTYPRLFSSTHRSTPLFGMRKYSVLFYASAVSLQKMKLFALQTILSMDLQELCFLLTRIDVNVLQRICVLVSFGRTVANQPSFKLRGVSNSFQHNFNAF